MPSIACNRTHPDDGRANDRPPEHPGIAEVVAEAEALRTVLQNASARRTPLLVALKQ
jgi:hypothetical protein